MLDLLEKEKENEEKKKKKKNRKRKRQKQKTKKKEKNKNTKITEMQTAGQQQQLVISEKVFPISRVHRISLRFALDFLPRLA